MPYRRRYLLYLIGFVLFCVLIGYYDPRSIAREIGAISFSWSLLAGLCIAAAGLLGAINVFLLVTRDQKLSFGEFLPVYWSSWAVGLLIPGQVGDVASIGFLLRRRSLALSTIWGRASLDKAISLAVILCIALVGLITFAPDLGAPTAWWFGFAAGLVAVLTLALCRNRWKNVFDAKSPGWRGGIARVVLEFFQTARAAPSRVLLNVAFTLVKVLLTGGSYWIMFHALGATNVSLLEVTVLAHMAGLIAYLPVSVNGVGTVEAAGIFLFAQIGVGATTVISAYIVLRMLVFVIAWSPSLCWVAFGPGKADSST